MPITRLPLFDDPYYTYSIDLDNEAFEFTFRWNSRAQQWMMTLGNSEGETVIRNIPVVPAFPLLDQYSLESPVGEIYLLAVNELEMTDPIPDPRRVFDTHRLYYVSPDE